MSINKKTILKYGKEKYIIEKERIIIGRSSKCDLCIKKDNRLSRRHCEIRFDKKENAYYIEDLNSQNGTFVNYKKITTKKQLKDRDIITIGNTILFFLFDEEISKEKNKVYLEVFNKKQNKKVKFSLKKDIVYRIGRSKECEISIPNDSKISNHHLEIFFKNGEWYIRDLNSTNGVIIKGKGKIEKEKDIKLNKKGEVILIGETILKFYNIKQEDNFTKFILLSFLSIFTLLISFFIIFKILESNNISHYNYINNLVEDFSFEEGTGWKLIGDFQFSSEFAKSGKYSLTIKDSKSKISKAIYYETFDIEYEKTYKIIYWTKYKDIKGIGGLKIAYYNKKDEKIDETILPLVSGTKERWEKIEAYINPPRYADYFKLIFFLIGKVDGFLSFDDVILTEEDIKKRRFFFKKEWIKLTLDNKGEVLIYNNLDLLIKSKILIIEKSNNNIFNQDYSIGNLIFNNNREIIWRGKIISLNNQNNFQLSLKIKKLSNNFDILFNSNLFNNKKRIKRDFSQEYLYTLKIFSQKLEKFFVFNSRDKAIKILNNSVFKLKKLELDNLIIFFKNNEFIKLDFKDLLKLIKIEKRGIFYYLVLKSNKFLEKISININTVEDLFNVKKIYKKSLEYKKIGKLGKCLNIYNKILKEYIFYYLKYKIYIEMKKINSVLLKDKEELNSYIKKAFLFKNLEYYRKVLGFCKILKEKWEKNKEMENIIYTEEKKIQIEIETKEKEIIDTKIHSLINKANFFIKEKKYLLALLIYNEIKNNYLKKYNNLLNKDLKEKILKNIEILKNKITLKRG